MAFITTSGKNPSLYNRHVCCRPCGEGAEAGWPHAGPDFELQMEIKGLVRP